MKILLSNDDGYYAPGLRTLYQYLLEQKFIQSVTVVAPDRNRSGASNSLTLDRPLLPVSYEYDLPLFLQNKDNHCYYLNGTPTDCVHVALTAMFENEIDIIISGINAGANMGDDVLYSGTVAGAMEGRHLGLPSIAVSLDIENNQYSSNNRVYYKTAAIVVNQILAHINEFHFNEKTILNINVPNMDFNYIKGMKITRLGQRHKAAPAEKSIDPRGRTVYWLGAVGELADAGEGTDFHAVQSGYVSITPLTVDQTDYEIHEPLSKWLNGWSL